MNAPDGRPIHFVLTCEHASPAIPHSCRDLLEPFIETCETHRVFDPGALQVAEELSERLKTTVQSGRVTRLAIDLNRSIGNENQFAPPIFLADERLKLDLIREYFIPFRQQTLQEVETAIAADLLVVHLSIHSFTKVFKGTRRAVDLGILFDTERQPEANIGTAWTDFLKSVLPEMTVRTNEPYLGIDDGHTTALRRILPEDRYLGFEVEISQDFDYKSDAENLARILFATLQKAIRSAANR